MDLPTERGPSAATIVCELETEKDPRPRLPDNLSPSHWRRQPPGKAFASIEIIPNLKLIETENRDATEAENSVLVRYAGWNAMANIFRPFPPAGIAAYGGQMRCSAGQPSMIHEKANDTGDYYPYFDAIAHAEFLY